VKRCGKSAPRAEQSVWQGKPHAEQDQIGEEELPAPLYFRVGRYGLALCAQTMSHIVMCGLDEWLSPARVQKPAYNPASANINFLKTPVRSGTEATPNTGLAVFAYVAAPGAFHMVGEYLLGFAPTLPTLLLLAPSKIAGYSRALGEAPQATLSAV